ncbi:ATP-dependent RNA helicase dbp10-like [Mizuhopecten yessoensis]|uniref:RNA helicase n=1 Tax=Mizuhopecten yessoensis TaxID=6573 RepID=A0A210PYK4_MIZYE|nr:ATP-dependent RNA helicase dbp10-like [Mizuhopecten yessoensis]OWF41567.1 ATP-dependent RNA helicase DDX20 [Mizuhopecten yessoensis]
MSDSVVAHNISEKKRTNDVLISDNIDFAGLLLSPPVLQGLKSSGFERPSPIQLKAIPLGRCGLDLIVQAKSGTGKTCVFSVIALEGLQTASYALQVLVLAPTREIAIQIWEVIRGIGRNVSHLFCQTFIGGMPIQEDRQKLKKCHIAVGTPGRIKQLIETGMMTTESIRMFVLDEADKLLEEGFQEQINWIYSSLPDNKQMLALSATYPEYLAQHLTAYMRNPTFLRLNIYDPALLGINQYYRSVPYHPLPHKQFENKTKIVTEILSSVNFQQCLIFSNLQTRAQNMADALTSRGWPTACIAGCLDQKDRNEAMSKLKTYKCRVLISTDLTSRGIDADKVDLVINLDIPKDHETYLHRIGRAGRFGTFGAAITIISQGQEELDLQSVEGKCNTHITPLPDPIPEDLPKSECKITIDDVVSSKQIITSPKNRDTFLKKKSRNRRNKNKQQKDSSLEQKSDQTTLQDDQSEVIEDILSSADERKDDSGTLNGHTSNLTETVNSTESDLNIARNVEATQKMTEGINYNSLEQTVQNATLVRCENDSADVKTQNQTLKCFVGENYDKDSPSVPSDGSDIVSSSLPLQIPSFKSSVCYNPVGKPHTYESAKLDLEHHKNSHDKDNTVDTNNRQFKVKVTSAARRFVDPTAKQDLLRKISLVLQSSKSSTLTTPSEGVTPSDVSNSVTGKEFKLQPLSVEVSYTEAQKRNLSDKRDLIVQQCDSGLLIPVNERSLHSSSEQLVQDSYTAQKQKVKDIDTARKQLSTCYYGSSISKSVSRPRSHDGPSQSTGLQHANQYSIKDREKPSNIRETKSVTKASDIRKTSIARNPSESLNIPADDMLEPSQALMTAIANVMKKILIHEKCSKDQLEEKIFKFLRKSLETDRKLKKESGEIEDESDISETDSSSDSGSSGEDSDDERTQVEEDGPVEEDRYEEFLQEEGYRNQTEWDECVEHSDDDEEEYADYDTCYENPKVSEFPPQYTQWNTWGYPYPVSVPPYYYPYPPYGCYPMFPGYPTPGYQPWGTNTQTQQYLQVVMDNQARYIHQMLHKT